MSFERVLRWALVTIAVAGLTAGIAARTAGRSDLADLCWTLATAPVVAGTGDFDRSGFFGRPARRRCDRAGFDERGIGACASRSLALWSR